MEQLRTERFGAEQKGSERSRETKGTERHGMEQKSSEGEQKGSEWSLEVWNERKGLESWKQTKRFGTELRKALNGSMYNIHICSQFEHFGDSLRTPVAPLMSPSPVCLSAEGAKNVSGP